MASQKKINKSKTTKKKSNTIATRIAKQKVMVLEMLEKVPIIEVTCKRVGISKATYYRWYHDDFEFAGLADIARQEGTKSINALAQSKLIELVNQSNLTAIIFWLKSRDPDFNEKKRLIIEPKKPKLIDPESKEAIDNVFTMFEKKAREVAPKYVVADDD